MKRLTRLAAACVASLAVLTGANAQDYPSQTIHVVVPWKAGGGTDNIGRGFAESLADAAGVNVVVDNIAGAGGITGSLTVAQATPDGYTILLNGTTDMTAAMTFQQVPISLDDFRYIGGVFDSPTWILANSEQGIETLDQLIEKAKAEPGAVTLGTAGPAGAQMLMASAIKGITGAELRIVPFSGGADLKKALIGNQVTAGILHAPVLLPETKEGMMKVLATGRPLDKLSYEPLRDTPTLEESGIAVKVGITRGIMVPKDTPDEIVSTLQGLVEKAAKSQSFRDFGAGYGFEPVWVPGDEFAEQIRDELELFRQIKAEHID